MFFKSGDPKNSAIFTRKHLCLSIFLIKLLKISLLKKRLQHRYFPVNIVTFLRRTFVIEHCFQPDPIISFDWLMSSLRSHHMLCRKSVFLLQQICSYEQADINEKKMINKNVSQWFLLFLFLKVPTLYVVVV